MPANEYIKYNLIKLLKQTEPAFMELEEVRVLTTMARLCDVDSFFEDLELQFPDPKSKLLELRNRLEQRLFVAYMLEAIFCAEQQKTKEATVFFKKAYALFSEADSQTDTATELQIILATRTLFKRKTKTNNSIKL